MVSLRPDITVNSWTDEIEFICFWFTSTNEAIVRSALSLAGFTVPDSSQR